MGVIADKLRDLQKTYKENNYAEYDQILDFAIEIADSEENKHCKWYVTHTPRGFSFYTTECGKMKLSCATGIDICCNACGRKIKIVDDKKASDSE